MRQKACPTLTNGVNLCPLVHLASLCTKHIAGVVNQPHCNCNRDCANTNVFPVLADIIVKTCDMDGNMSLWTGEEWGEGQNKILDTYVSQSDI